MKGDDEDGYIGIVNLKVCYFEVRQHEINYRCSFKFAYFYK